MACRCKERKAAIVEAIKKPTTALTAAQFVVKTGAQDLAQGAKRVTVYLQRRGMRS